MPERILTAMYDSRSAAEAARDQLAALGIARESISIRGADQGTTAGTTTGTTASTTREEPGLWGSIMDALFPEEDRYTYDEGVRRGGYLLSARVPEGLEDRAHDVLDSTDAVNVEERAESWRQSGWAGYQGGTAGTAGTTAGVAGSTTSAYGSTTSVAPGEAGRTDYATGTAGASGTGKSHDFGTGPAHSGVVDRVSDAASDAAEATGLKREDYDEERRGLAGTAGTAGTTGTVGTADYDTGRTAAVDTGLGAVGTSTTRDVAEGGVVERAEEQLRVGKRDVGRGSVKVRSYVVERPVEEQVNLRQERVDVERRPVDRPVRPGDDVFQEKVIEATERGEEAVVSKEARVVEEIGLRKQADTRTETVRDTVREQKVEVEDNRTDRGAGGVVREERALGTDERVAGTDEDVVEPDRTKPRI